MTKNIAFFAVLITVLSSLAFATDHNAGKKAIPEGALIIDVRTPAEYRHGHYPGAKNIPLGSLAHRISELGPTDGKVVVYCRSGNRSGMAQRLLERAGYRYAVNGGGLREMLLHLTTEQ